MPCLYRHVGACRAHRDTFGGGSGSASWSFLPFLRLRDLYVSVGAARLASTYAETWAGWSFRYITAALLRRNLLAATLRRPGALAPPVSSGEAVNRYRDDVGEVTDFPTWLPDVAGNLVSLTLTYPHYRFYM